MQGEEWRAYLSSLAATVAALAVFTWWFLRLTSLGFQPLGTATLVLEACTIVVFPVLAGVAAWFVVAGLKAKRGRFSVVVRSTVVLAALCLVWVSIAFNLIHLGLNDWGEYRWARPCGRTHLAGSASTKESSYDGC